MANVSFKRGTQQHLDEMSTYVEGAFYLTTDTDRLYFAQANNELVELNQFVHSVATLNNLPAENTLTASNNGDFYYIEDRNILCRFDNSKDTGKKWVQINPDHNTELVAGTNGLSVSSVTNGAQVGMAVADSSGKEVSGNFQILGSSNITITPNADNKTITITTPDNVNTTYSLSTEQSATQGKIKLTPSGSDPTPDVVTLAAGANIGISDNGSGTITISGQPSVDNIAQSFDANGHLITTISQGNNPAVSNASDNFTPTISYGQSTTNAVFNNGTAALSVYTQAEVDTKINDAIRVADAMTFKGVLGASNDVPTSQVKLGDTYKLAADKSGVNAKKGDLIIATGTEDSNTGYVTSDSLSWEVVPSGDEQILTAANNASNNTFEIIDQFSNTIDSFTLSQDSGTGTSKIGISATNSQSGDNINFVLSHGAAGDTNSTVGNNEATAAVSQSAKGSVTIPVITSVAKDVHGHVTTVTTANYTLTDTHASMDSFTYSVSASNNSAAFTLGTGLDGQGDRDAQQVISSSSLAIAADDSVTIPNGSTLDAAAGITIDLVWGSF